LENIDLELPAGAVVAVVGENGAGKSTLVKLLCRFYEPTAGRIMIDEVDLRTLEPESWRSRLAGAFQDFFRFEYEAQTSIGLGDLPRRDDTEAVSAAVARAGIADVVRRLPDGLQTRLGVGWPYSTNLSFGQWQKIALARGFMRRTPLLLVLDEPAASLDAEAEHELFDRYAEAAQAVDQVGGDQITFLISHRFSTAQMADVIVVLDGARVIEQGSHQDLMMSGGPYSELFIRQSAAYR
jgi:ATP-binding cassette subfamily B protein